jgi:hypothetical protein
LIHLVLLLASAAAIEIFIRLGFMKALESVVDVTGKARRVVLSGNISDHWKELVLPTYSTQIIKACLRMLLVLGLMVACFLAGDLLLPGTLDYVMSAAGLLESVVIGMAYIGIRRSIVSHQ